MGRQQPGSTLLIPISDQVESTFNQLWIRTGEGAVVIDPKSGRVLGDPGELIKVASSSPTVPFRCRRSKPTRAPAPRRNCRSRPTLASCDAGEGLGGWLFSGINTQAILGAFAPKGVEGFGFRFDRREHWTQPNPVGLDGHFEPLVPPYVPDMHVAAKLFADRKFGRRGNHHPNRRGPYRDNARVKSRTDVYSPAFVRYIGTLAQDVYDTYGKFPGTQPSIGIAAYTQAHHIDLDFYDAFYKDGAYLQTHADHQRLWHDEERDG